MEFFLQAVFHSCQRAGYLSCYKVFSSSLALVIEQDSVARENIICLSEIFSYMKCENFGAAIWTSWVKRRRLCLRNFCNFAEHFRRRGLIKSCFRVNIFNCFKQN